MIDIHSHILAGLDDGAQTLSDSIAMAEMAEKDGVKRIVATPHNVYWEASLNRERVVSLVADLQSELSSRRIEVEIVPGVEAYISPDLVEHLRTGRAFTLGGTRYLLIEFPLSGYPIYTEKVIFELQVKGITPIIAHPERNAVLMRDPNLLQALVERGCLAQVTAASLVGVFGQLVREIALAFLENNLAHIIASDAHTLSHRSPILSKGVEEAARVIGSERAIAMVEEIPAAILRDEKIEFEPPTRYKPRRKWFWRK
jgi:protein-tyrosine phosphatase